MDKVKVSKSCSWHAVLVPFPDQGHLNPMLHLALRLVSRGAMVTFACTQRDRDRLCAVINHKSELGLRFVAMPVDGLPPDQAPIDSTDVEASPQGPVFCPVADPGPSETLQAPMALESLIRSSFDQGDIINGGSAAAAARPVSCLISDAFLPWTRDVARKCDVRWLVLWAASATWLCTAMYGSTAAEPEGLEGCRPSQELDIPGLPFAQDHAAAFFSTGFLRPFLTAQIKALKNADCVIVNTFDHLEKEALSLLPSTPPALTVGPLFYGLPESLKNEDADCFPWLDRQERRSVVYIAFGSKVLIQEQLLQQLAMGIEASGKPFLWVIRCKKKHQQLEGLKDFNLRTQGRGLVVPWAPQVRVLEHPAIGAFVTHCGWNSVLESIAMGVPMVCCPLFMDQLSNRMLVEQHWRVGRAIPMTKMQANDVQVLINNVMEDKDMRDRAFGLSLSVQAAMQDGGSSYRQLESLMQDYN